MSSQWWNILKGWPPNIKGHDEHSYTEVLYKLIEKFIYNKTRHPRTCIHLIPESSFAASHLQPQSVGIKFNISHSSRAHSAFAWQLKRPEFAPMNKPTVTYYWPGKCYLRLVNMFLREGKLGRSSITLIECSKHNKHSQITKMIIVQNDKILKIVSQPKYQTASG